MTEDGRLESLPWVPQDDYTPEALAACEKALRTIISRIGKWGPRLILFGGLAPRYLVESPPPELDEHTGTTDVDVVVGVEIDVGAGSKISAIQLRGAEIAAMDCMTVTLSGEVLDDGGHRDVEVQVANILPFLVLKAFALVTRDKEKDAYDIVWTLQAYGEAGPVSAAEAALASPIVARDEVAEAMAILEERFAELDRQGPSNYARFFLGGRGDAEEERTRLRRDARGTVLAFLARWKELRG